MSFGTVSKSVFTSKTFWTCLVGALAEIATASGVHVLDDPAMQAQIVGLLTAAFAGVFRFTATQPTHLVPPAVLLLAFGLSGCGGVPAAVIGGLGSAGSAYLAVDKITEGAAPYIATGCAEYQKAKAAADAVTPLLPASVGGKVSAIESFGDAACLNPPAGDPISTTVWLGQLAGQLMTLTKG